MNDPLNLFFSDVGNYATHSVDSFALDADGIRGDDVRENRMVIATIGTAF